MRSRVGKETARQSGDIIKTSTRQRRQRVQACIQASDAKAVNRKKEIPTDVIFTTQSRLAVARATRTSTRSLVNVNMSSLFPRHPLDISPSLLTPPSAPLALPPRYRPSRAPRMVDPAAIRGIIRLIDAAATLVCNEIDKALELEHEARPALKDLRKEIENLKAGIMAFEVLMNAIRVDAAFTFVQVLYVM